MSKIGKNPIIIPNNLFIYFINNYVIFQSKNSVFINKIPFNLNVLFKNNFLHVLNENQNSKIWGTFRTLLYNSIKGVTKGYIIKLKLIGIGFKVYMKNKYLILKVGFTNKQRINIPLNIKIKCINNNTIYLYSTDFQQLKLFASMIKAKKKPDVYKGKGILFSNEKLNLKLGKKKKK